ncbi:hypothetical protein EYF80_047363 [Liparis tanakae]|uniref:Uncharacterized protein n=1 Tax=Liparis tanakae TaxID=230148 RepID=A0A4Z2FMK9_9TELE|nr:hypothetical protein EYF80_047363 [Liparis tanakae]
MEGSRWSSSDDDSVGRERGETAGAPSSLGKDLQLGVDVNILHISSRQPGASKPREPRSHGSQRHNYHTPSPQQRHGNGGVTANWNSRTA